MLNPKESTWISDLLFREADIRQNIILSLHRDREIPYSTLGSPVSWFRKGDLYVPLSILLSTQYPNVARKFELPPYEDADPEKIRRVEQLSDSELFKLTYVRLEKGIRDIDQIPALSAKLSPDELLYHVYQQTQTGFVLAVITARRLALDELSFYLGKVYLNYETYSFGLN